MAAVCPDTDLKYIVFYMMRRVALRTAKTKLEASLGCPPSRDLIEAEADTYTSNSGAMVKLIVDIRASQPPGLQPCWIVQNLAVLFGCSNRSVANPTTHPDA